MLCEVGDYNEGEVVEDPNGDYGAEDDAAAVKRRENRHQSPS